MLDIRRSQLQRIINDNASTAEEREEAERELQDAVPRREQDALITRFLDHQMDSECWVALHQDTKAICRALTSWMVGIELDRLDQNIEILIALHHRTQSLQVKTASREGIEQWLKLAKHYANVAGSDQATRRSIQFLESNPT